MTVTFFGHRNTPYSAQTLLEEAIIDLIVAYVSNGFGGAYNSMKLAERKGKRIINLADL